MLFAGHNAPGGGFIGGLIAASAIVLRATAQGPDDIRRLVPVEAEAILGAGALFAAVTGVLGYLVAGSFLGSAYVDFDLPVLGHVKIVSVLFFDIGVYLIVFGLGLVLVRTLGGDAEIDVPQDPVRGVAGGGPRP
jgi:multicomponent Na+:H+ antiporter subunit A